MRPGYYRECLKLAKWMEKNKESVIGTQPVMNWSDMSKYPMTRRDQAYYIHLLNDTLSQLEVTGIEKPQQVLLLDTGEKLSFKYLKGKKLLIDLQTERNHPVDAVIKLDYK